MPRACTAILLISEACDSLAPKECRGLAFKSFEGLMNLP